MKFGLDDDVASSSSASSHASTSRTKLVHPNTPHELEEEDSDTPVPLEQLSPRPIRKAPFRKHAFNPSSSSFTTTKSFSPKPIKLTPLPNTPSISSRKGKLIKYEINSSDDEDGDGRGSSSDDEDASDDDDEVDSEEDEWPVGPIGSIGINGWRKAASVKRRGTTRLKDDQVRVYGGRDAFQIWDDRAKATSWATANRSFHLSLARSFSASPTPTSKHTADVSSIESMLSSLALQAKQEKKRLVDSFEERNKKLWDSIELSIREAEKEEEGKQRVLEENRKKREEQERKAREMREREEKIKKDEEARKEKERIDRERREEAERQQKEKADQDKIRVQEERDKKLALTAPPSGKGVEGSPQAEWEKWTGVMTHIKTSVLPIVSQNPAYRKECFAAKRAITPKIGQLTASAETTLRVINQLDQILSSMRPPPGGPTEPYLWTLNHLSKSLVKQAETEVTAKLSTAYPLGRVVIGLLTRGHKDLGDVLMARLVKKCFWITGWWPAKQSGQTEEAYQKTLGHAPPSSSESIIQYASRMSGLIALYGSIVQTSPMDPPQGPCPLENLANVPKHFRLESAWRWIVLILRVPLVGLQPTPQLLGTFLEIAGERLLEVYGRQFGKVLDVLLKEGIREPKAGFSEKSVSSTVRLTLYLEEWEQKRRLETSQGRKPDP